MNSDSNQARTRAGRGPRFILITQCLQNDFFLERNCKLCLPPYEAAKILIGKRGLEDDTAPDELAEKIRKAKLSEGPLGQFLKKVIGERPGAGPGKNVLHVINIRDWHRHRESYDEERRKYGAHCERNTSGAAYISGLQASLDPHPGDEPIEETSTGLRARSKGNVWFYHIYSDSVFDFKPIYSGGASGGRKFRDSKLEQVLDVLILGTDEQVGKMQAAVTPPQDPVRLKEIVDAINKVDCTGGGDNEDGCPRTHVIVIGAYTDIKIKTLLTGLRSRYDIPCLAVSDTLTGSPALERHLGALDFFQKVLSVEVIHGLNDLITLLGADGDIKNEEELIAADRFSDYASFFQDKQNVLAYRTQKLQEYLTLTQKRAKDLYKVLKRGNELLIWFGSGLLGLTALGAIVSAIKPDWVDWKLPLVTGGISLIQIVSVFFRRPMAELQRNLTNLTTLRMILESHSLKVALARFHLTTPQTLQEDIDTEKAEKQVDALKSQIEAIEQIENSDREALRGLGFGMSDADEKRLQGEEGD